MMGHKTGVAKRIQDLQPKAYPTHCHGHSLSFPLSSSSLYLFSIVKYIYLYLSCEVDK